MDDISGGQTNHADVRDRVGMAPADLGRAPADFTAGTPNFAMGSSNWNGIRANLAEMEKKLGELQQQVDPRHPSVTLQQQVDLKQPIIALQQALPNAQTMPAAHVQATQVKQQIEDLLRVREMLRESLRNAIGECERALGQLDRGEPLSSALGNDAGERLLASTAPAAPAAAIALRPSVFQGKVSLRIGPLSDISQVDTLEIALLQVPGTEQVEIKEFAGRNAVAEIRLFQPVRLVEELHRVLPFTFEVTHGDAGALTLLAAAETVAADGNSVPVGASSTFAFTSTADSEEI